MVSPNLLQLAVIASVLSVLYTPFLIYAILQWSQNKQHYIIKKRFPTISYAMVIVNCLSYILATILYWLRWYMPLHSLALYSVEAMQMAVFGMINLRLFLIYLRWKATYAIIHGLIEIKSAKSIYKHWFSIILILLATICPIFTAFNLGKQAFWAIYIIITISLICIIVFKKVHEGISVTKETLLQLCVVLFTGLLAIFSGIIPALEWPVYIIFNLSAYAQCTLVLYFPIYQINKLEKFMMNPQMESRLPASSEYSSHKSSTEVKQESKQTTIDISSVKKEGELFQFLVKHSNYIVFRNYMVHSWAEENLNFVEQSQILRRVVMKYAKNIEPNQRHVHRMGFKYLKGIYSGFQQRIDEQLVDEKQNEDIRVDEIKNVLYELHNDIYQQFIKQGAADMINISYEARKYCISLFANKEYSEKFTSFDDFIHIFDDAVLEIYRLLLSMYQFRFEQYLEQYNKK